MFGTVDDNELVEVAAEDFGTDVPLPPLYAHFFSKTARKPAELIVTETPALNSGTIFHTNVTGKAEARKFARQYGAQCWNF